MSTKDDIIKEIVSLMMEGNPNEEDEKAEYRMYSQDYYTEEVLREILARLRDQKAMGR